ncbi:enoyl-CoA hydratase/isomerase family protein [Roseibium sp. RKSG952]|uniref:enoyl-CoA hydratase/isomerase family protein n=1 Tax=Roseibium sp. RKSG952 TaxID=2529384 RepID=UPI0012BCE037|nr:enoyl-CoA hydratase/isomerase family protein [Roseibium sp. RKSG952]MTH97754.1 enoyl-CoA hydratase/isomerase family protein [Roseibium sp. RKSG952]
MSDEILFERRGCAGFVKLNRPKALNALSFEMVRALSEQLDKWATDAQVERVVITGKGEKAFCAGGDIRSIYEDKKAGKTGHLADFFGAEYLLNAKIKRYPKPYIALIDGIVMGGGVGVSVHGAYRVGTEFTTFAMPETGIGFFPDVGGTYFLPRMPHHVGVYCAMTAGRLKQADAMATGILTHTVRRVDLGELSRALEAPGNIDEILSEYRDESEPEPAPAPLLEYAEIIEAAFGEESVADIMACLAADESDWSTKVAETIRAKSPTSVHLAFEQMKRGKELPFEDCMKLEFRIVNQVLKGHDFFEGVRAVLVDKDHKPNWSPDTLDEVDHDDLAAYFAEPECGDLPLP